MAFFSWPYQEPLEPGLLSYMKVSKLGNISNSCHWVTHMGLKPPQNFFFENISKSTAARGFQNFGLIEGAAGIPSGL